MPRSPDGSSLRRWLSPAFLILALSCSPGESGGSGSAGGAAVVVYTSVDQVFSEPLLAEFEAETGIRVTPVFDIEAAKTTGLVNRLKAEQAGPQADVWWNGEFSQTIELAEAGVLAAYVSPSAADIPDAYKDAAGYWTGFGGRARVIIANTDSVTGDPPDTIADFVGAAGWDPAAGPPTPAGVSAEGEAPGGVEPVGFAPDRIGIAHPVFGTTATHVAALYALWGRDAGRAFMQAVHDRGTRVVDGNSVVRDLVADGDLAFGLTDTDDACGAVERGAPVAVVIPDQAEGRIGTLVIPNTVGLVAGGPNPEGGRRFVDYLLSPEVEARLVERGWIQIGLRPLPPDVAAATCVDVSAVRGMDVSLADIAAQIEQAKTDMAEMFVQ